MYIAKRAAFLYNGLPASLSLAIRIVSYAALRVQQLSAQFQRVKVHAAAF